jgi:hypothetical protein
MEHNKMVAWVRAWGAIGSKVALQNAKSRFERKVARELHQLEVRRYAVACYALGTTEGCK